MTLAIGFLCFVPYHKSLVKYSYKRPGTGADIYNCDEK